VHSGLHIVCGDTSQHQGEEVTSAVETHTAGILRIDNRLRIVSRQRRKDHARLNAEFVPLTPRCESVIYDLDRDIILPLTSFTPFF